MNRQLGRLGTPIFFVIAVVGCGSDYTYVPVSGQVTMDGKPLAEVVVMFQPTGGTLNTPAKGRGSNGRTDAEGRFTLQVNSDQSGAVPGKHRVAISKKIRNLIETLPKQYNSESTLTFEVPPEGTDAADFSLKTKP